MGRKRKMARTGTLTRLKGESGDDGTFAQLVVGPLEIYSGELPWRGDAANVSCLPPAPDEGPLVYLLQLLFSPAHKRKVYHFVKLRQPDGSWGPLRDGRTNPECHAANLMGDIFKGFGAQLEGCVAPGRAIVTFPQGEAFHSFTAASPTALVPITLAQPQRGVASSGDALAAFEAELAGEDLELTVQWA